MKVIFAASDALCHWVDVSLPRLEDDQKLVDRGLLVSDKYAVSWQCYLVPHGCWGVERCAHPLEHGKHGADLVFIGAYSRYVIICPNVTVREPEMIEYEFKTRVMAEIGQMMTTLGGDDELVEHCASTIERLDCRHDWYQYTAPNMRQRFLEVKSALKAFYKTHVSGQMTEEQSYEMGLLLNTRTIQAHTLTTDETVDTFVPVERILRDWLIRFGDGAHALVRDNQEGDMVRILRKPNASFHFLTAKIKNLRATKITPVEVYRRRKQIIL